MCGSELTAGGVAMVTNIKNPITLARRVLDSTPHVLICGEGAIKVAEDNNVPIVSAKSLISDYALKILNEWRKNGARIEVHFN